MCTRAPAYNVGVDSFSTARSSQASSLVWLMRAFINQAAGWNDTPSETSSQMRFIWKSILEMCASSWHTAVSKSAPDAVSRNVVGISKIGCITPTVNGPIPSRA